MNEPLPVDVTARLHRDFGDRAERVAALLVSHRRVGSEDNISDRLVRCIVHAANGDEQRVQELIDQYQRDYRDVIVAGEYDSNMRRVRDLCASFLIDSPEKFWVGEVTRMMASRGYQLTSIETRPAGSVPFAHEGRATFIGPKGEIEIEQQDGRWLIHLDRDELEIHRLNHAFDDEQAFRDAVSGYLLSNVSVRNIREQQNL